MTRMITVPYSSSTNVYGNGEIQISRKWNKSNSVYGPCSTICPISFRLITFEIRRIARKADHSSRDHQGCANKICFGSFPFSASLKRSKFQVVKITFIAKSAVVNITTNSLRNVPIEKKNRSPAYLYKKSFGHLYFVDIYWVQMLKDSNINDVPVSVVCLFHVHFWFSNKSEYHITCTTPTAVEIRCPNSAVIILPFETLKYKDTVTVATTSDS